MHDISNPTLAFIAQIVSSVVWPFTTIACVLLLRPHLLRLIHLIRSVKYSDLEIKFVREVEGLAEDAKSTSLPPKPSAQQAREWEEITRLADVRPRTAIRMAFRRLEELLAATARQKNIAISDAAGLMPMVVGAHLLSEGVIDTEQYDLLSRLRLLLNEAEQAPVDAISASSARTFINLSQRLATAIRG